MEEKWKYDLFAETDGLIALLPFGEVKLEIRKQPKAMYKILEIAANQAYETTHYNLRGESTNSVIPFYP